MYVGVRFLPIAAPRLRDKILYACRLAVAPWATRRRGAMYFDRRLWALTRGLRGRIALSILIGLGAAAFGIARFTLLGTMLSRVFAGSGFMSIALVAVGVAAAVVLRGYLDHLRTQIAHGTA